ncbi:transglycosylase [Pseudoclavibacter sp. CFCC 14310]|uniref:aggregation-promoting factor C-terminal-like domain-containing protein n=1 Tax=Pseudoclavibacter sp. CFCC 14310 TaxID=2615180 RepID=UPI0017882C88|nr:transglycosylase [Pseudoclavibacter sp. CFCC 14310]
MTSRRRPLRWAAGSAAACTLATALAVTPSSFAPGRVDLPLARADAAGDTQSQIDAINGQLDDLEQRSDEAGDAAVRAQGDASDAQQALTTATEQVAALQGQIDTARAAADEARRNSTSAVQQLARGTGMETDPAGQLVTSRDPSAALWRLTTLGQVSQQTDQRMTEAGQRASELQALTDQQQQVESERERLAREAESDAQAASAASASADAAVSALQTQQQGLLQQLADIKRTTAAQEAEERRQRELAASIAASNQPQAAASDSAPASSSAPTQPQTPAVPNRPAPAPAPAPTPTPAPAPSPAPAPAPAPAPSGGSSPAAAKAYAQSRISQMGWGNDQFVCLVNLWQKESGWQVNAENRSSGAYGIPQSLPGSKMGSVGADWRTNAQTQIEWGLGYIRGRYGTPCGAWGHSQSTGWY